MLITALLALALPSLAPAAVLHCTPGSTEIAGVKVCMGAQLSAPPISLGLVGAGLRYKKVAFIKAKVYVGEFFADSPAKVLKTFDGALASLAAEKVMAMRMTFVRDVDGEKVRGGFREALEENKVPLNSPEVKQFLDAITSGGAVKENQTLTIVGDRRGAKETVSYENAAGTLVVIPGSPGFVQNIFSMWLGKIDDSGLESFKFDVLGLKK